MAQVSLFHCLHFLAVINLITIRGTYTARESDVVFIFYNQETNGQRIFLGDSDKDLMQLFKDAIPTVLITHGWTKNETHISVTNVRDGYLNTRDVNVIEVGWGPISQNNYMTAWAGVSSVGHIVGQLLAKLVNAKLISVDSIHLLGHSLGAHICGVAAGFVLDSKLGKVFRITAFDPAGPGYHDLTSNDDKLSKDDAQFVDVIHTCVRLFGLTDPIGHADFYPNEGSCSQPGCNLISEIFCGHGRSWRYYVESLYYEHNFPALKCDNGRNYKNNNCKNNSLAYMGVAAQACDNGVYYLTTNSNPPFGRRNALDP